MKDMKLSVCLIVKDEREVIARCLECALKFADEIVIVDTGSSDGTLEIVKEFTDKVYSYEWNYDFSAARNYAFDKAGGEFLMWLDADDVVTDENCEKIKKLMESDSQFDMAFLPYVAALDGDTVTFVYYRERIFRRKLNYKFSGAVHEAVEPSGRIIYYDAEIFHKKVKAGNPLRNLVIYQKLIAQGICLNEREKFYYGRELLFNKMYRESIAVLEYFLNGDGWTENKIEACINLFRAYSAVGRIQEGINCIFKSFLYAAPRSEACCILGGYFADKNDFNSAIYWYQSAINADNGLKNGGFVNRDFCGFIPYIQLCVLYDRLGDYKLAKRYNDLAGNLKPNNESYLKNKIYFEKKLGKQE